MDDQNKRSFVMIRIPAGEFTMGSRAGHGEADEFPAHTVYLDEYLIGRYPVAAAEWAAFLNSSKNPDLRYFESSDETTVVLIDGKYYPRRGCSRHPANGVTWYGAEAFCKWLSAKTGRNYRLPTEAEWEKAARGGLDGKRYPWGNEPPVGLAQFQQQFTDPKHTLCPVGSFQPNGYGLYDMAGNVWEWCSDWYERDYYHASPEKGPCGPETGTLKTIRGGSWGGLDIQVRCGIRVGDFPDVSESRVGFRVARTP